MPRDQDTVFSDADSPVIARVKAFINVRLFVSNWTESMLRVALRHLRAPKPLVSRVISSNTPLFRSPPTSTVDPRTVRSRAASKSSKTAPASTSLAYPVTPFSFLPANALPAKPRTLGLTEIRGPYYSPVTQTYLDELLKDWGAYVDGVKFAGGSFSLMPKERLKGLIDVAHAHGCYVSTGGYIERVLASSAGNEGMVKQYLEACKEMGFDVIEISSGFLTIPTRDWTNLIKLTKSYELKPKPEVGIQWGAGGGAPVAELEEAETRDPIWLIDRAHAFLEAGAEMIMIESEGITENVRTWRTDVISAITAGLPNEKIMFEASDPDVFSYHIQTQGAKANLFIDHSQVVQLACLRRGIWGTGKTFGRVVTFGSD